MAGLALSDAQQVALAVAALPNNPDRWDIFKMAAAQFTESGMDKAMRSLKAAGYVDHGAIPRWATLTDKGRRALDGLR
jgi:hypothetical protein